MTQAIPFFTARPLSRCFRGTQSPGARWYFQNTRPFTGPPVTALPAAEADPYTWPAYLIEPSARSQALYFTFLYWARGRIDPFGVDLAAALEHFQPDQVVELGLLTSTNLSCEFGP